MTLPVSVVIPTYGRDQVLVDTIASLLPQIGDGELLIVDQTPRHGPTVEKQLSDWRRDGEIRWLKREKPSITAAMNFGLTQAHRPIVLFLDDDIVPAEDLIEQHSRAYAELESAWAVVGQVLQPGEVSRSAGPRVAESGLLADLAFPFWADAGAWVSNVMAGNLSVKREFAISAGGFDENFVGSAYRFETEFARRLIRAGGKIRYVPEARIDHLRADRGGTRTSGSHLTSASPLHGVGDYYFALRSGISPTTIAYMLRRPFREVRTKFHLRHPWYIPVKLFGEMRAMVMAVRCWAAKPKLLSSNAGSGSAAVREIESLRS